MTMLGLAALAAVAGCQEAVRLDNPTRFASADADYVENVARRVLEELRFDIEYPEASEGRLATRGLTGASWFEFWRDDTIGTDQRVEASLHTIRRRALVSITPAGGGAEVFVKVTKERLTAPGAGPQSIGETYSIYDFQISELFERDELAPTPYEWVDQGRDERLEQEILARLAKRLGPVSPLR
jgi:hypothetical protein